MHTQDTNQNQRDVTSRRRRIPGAIIATVVGVVSMSAGIAMIMSGAPSTASADSAHGAHGAHEMRMPDQTAAMVANAKYQDVAVAESAGWTSTIDALGCFQDVAKGGMGVHYLNSALMDGVVDITKPEALVYELDADGNVSGLVAHEYIVPVEAWTSKLPPRLFGMAFHRHPVLPLWVMHTWLWKENPTGMFSDWNPAVRPCPSGVPIFGVDLPA